MSSKGNAWHQHYETAIMIGPVFTVGKASSLGMSLDGCPYRGTPICLKCPLAEYSPPALCGYKCVVVLNNRSGARQDCEHRATCKCGHDQTPRLRAWGLIP